MTLPDPEIVQETYLAIRQRHAAERSRDVARMDEEHQYWERAPLLERRVGWRAAGCPRFLYKYRGSVATTQGRKRCEDILLRHQLWLADSSKYEDPDDSQVEYRVSISGDELFRELVAHTRRTAIVSRFKAERMVSELVAKDPSALQGMLKADAEKVLLQWGICSLAANARGRRLWAEYGETHTGVCFQFHPAQDFRAFIDLQKVDYSDAERVIENRFFGDEVRMRRFDLMMTKNTKYDFEDEWRIVVGGKANAPYSFQPAALCGVILGAGSSVETKRVVGEILDERLRATGLKPHIYQAEFSDKRIRIHRLAT
jgi:hypothetical protein